jgi:hypothetical protein
LFLHDPRAIWRHLTIIALEDVGLADIGMVAEIIAAKSQHQFGRRPGLLWATYVRLTERLSRSSHSQAICDLLLKVENDPALWQERNNLIEADRSNWSEALYDPSTTIESRAVAALCFGGFMELRGSADPSAVFEICSETSSSEVVDTARSAWSLSRNPMALLLPLVWQASRAWTMPRIVNDPIHPAATISGVPEYALDQFTRVGKSVFMSFVQQDAELQAKFRSVGLCESDGSRVVGDLIFLLEGGRCVRRTTWEEAEALRSPVRWLPSSRALGDRLQPIMEYLASKRRQLTVLRQQLFQRAARASV